MLYRSFGRTGRQLSILGYGCMRFPTYGNGKVKQKEAIEMLRYGIDNGINYIDTAYPYHDGMSEVIVGKALSDGYREKVNIATKCPSWMIKEESDFERILDEQLARLKTDHIDFYLLHALDAERWASMLNKNVFTFLEKAKREGKITFIGFSFHDNYNVFQKIVDAYDWDFCQIQYNYLDENTQAGKAGLQYAYSKGMGVVIMEGLRGGTLARRVPKEIVEIWQSANKDRKPAEWGLKYLWDQKEVGVVLSGMSTIEQVEENIRSTDGSVANCFSDSDRQTVARVEEVYKSRLRVNCTGCSYCMPCPFGVNIPLCFRFWNMANMHEQSKGIVKQFTKKYKGRLSESERADKCRKCGRCESLCPQKISIRDKLNQVKDYFSKE